MTIDQKTLTADAQIAAAVAQAVAPAFGPNALLAVTIANNLLAAAVASLATVDVTDEQLQALMDADAAAKAIDDAAQRAASGGPI